MKTPSWTKLLAIGLACASVLLTMPARALDIIGPAGGIYTSVADSSHYDGSYVAANLFDFNVTGFASGASITGGNEYARSGGGDCYVSFQLDMVYTNVGSIFYAQRNGSDPNADKVATISIWGDPATPFAASDPGRAPDSTVSITNKAGARFTEYLMTNIVAGQYFLLKLSQASAAGNPGGSELRLGASLGIPPVFTQSPTDKAVYAGSTARFSAVATGTAPLLYQWYLGASPLSNGGRIVGANTANLIITNVNSGDAGAYTVIVSNSTATATATANLSLATALTDAAEVQTIAANPRAFWQLNEPSGSGVAFDYVGSFNGTYGGSSGSGSPGPQAPTYPGFAATNTALQTYSFTIDSAVTVPPMNISTTNSVTILAWIYQDGAAGPQQPYTGIVYCRGTAGQTSAGMICSGDGTQLAYQWAGNRYNFSSGLVIPTNQWTLVGIVYTPTATT
ncbi:MAG TPA: immunoglobulin domain-containing protein, partial [Verrucomicrobiae bacterium]|nr:immunoglobulin domain-containing protein [Verrucomicrobiae bacterium]